MRYKPENIKIGDEVTFRSTNPSQPDFDECWTVHGKEGTRLLIHLNYIGQKHYWTIDVSEVVTKIPTSEISLNNNLK